ncbi:MAG: TrkH family potassium uptake protein [bacterium]|nr:TrkH family potassium uptake protein [bacterium]
MHKTAVGYAIGKLMQVIGLLLLVPLSLAFFDLPQGKLGSFLNVPEISGFLVAILVALVIGTTASVVFKSGKHLQGIKEGYAIVTFGWISLSFVCSIPFTFYFASLGGDYSSILLAFSDGFFEVMSGFTTTGATIFSNVESVPRSLLFLRALTHWLGGMGIITLAMVIFPAMGVVGYQMFRGEVPGPTTEKLFPRLAHTASILWGVYLLLTAVETALLMFGGMGLFESVCHSFATMATGGFSTRNASIASFHSDYIEWVVTIFMYFAGINFLLHFRALRGDFKSFKYNREFIFYTATILITILITTFILNTSGLAPEEAAAEHFRHERMSPAEFHQHYNDQSDQIKGIYNSFRVASFQTLAIVTTTGFATADFDMWPDFLRFLLVFLMFFGGCAGSTGGGIKIVRIMIVAKVALRELRKVTQPRLVAPLKLGRQPIDDGHLINVVSFVILFIGLFIVTAAIMTLFVPDITTAVACSIATIGNIGPGLAGVGAMENYGWIPIPGKWIMILSMLLGRLEIFTVLIVLRPAVWRK